MNTALNMADFFSFDADSHPDTQRLGAALAKTLSPGTVVGLVGTLGSGKTKLVQGIAVARGVDAKSVVSPTYVILHEYPGPVTLYHFDLYRVADEDEWNELGADEILEQQGIVLIEWADRFRDCMPHTWLEIAIDVISNDQRRFTFIPHGDKAHQLVADLQSRLSA